jgi:RNA polymerase sigma factor (sigma-70 family)
MPAPAPALRPPCDETLLPRLARREPRAWREVVARYERLVRARVRGFRLQPADAEDAVSATWLRLAQNADRIEHADRLAGWLSTVAGRECLRLLDRSTHAGIPVEDVGVAVPEPAPGPEQRALDVDLARELRLLVAALPRRRMLLITALFADEPWSYERISVEIGIPTGSIGPTRARALEQLRQAAVERGLDPTRLVPAPRRAAAVG